MEKLTQYTNYTVHYVLAIFKAVVLPMCAMYSTLYTVFYIQYTMYRKLSGELVVESFMNFWVNNI